MPAKTCLALAVLLLSLPLPYAAAQGNLVINGGFDTASGWVMTNGTFFQSGLGNPGGCVILDSVSPSASTDPTVSQLVTGLIPGERYAVSGQYSLAKDRGGGSYTNTSLGVAIGGSFMFQAFALSNIFWQTFAFPYNATSSTVTLSLSSQINGTGQSYNIDNIALQPLPTLLGRIAGTNIVLKWPTNIVGFVLQSSTNLSSAATWLNVTNGTVFVGSNRTVTVGATRPRQYFRLKL